ASAYSPSYVQALDHVRHQFSVVATVNHGSTGRGGASCDGYHVRVNGTCCPWWMGNSATDVSPSPRTSIRVHSATESGPAVAVHRWPIRLTHGIDCP